MGLPSKVKNLVLVSFIVFICLIGGMSTFQYFGMEKDNPVEQFFEMIVSYLTGSNIDISGEG